MDRDRVAPMIYLHVAELVEGTNSVPEAALHYLGHVRRAVVGEAVTLLDGRGAVGRGVLANITSSSAVVEVSDLQQVARPTTVRALVPLIKGDRLTYAIEKLVEVGASEIVLVRTERAVVTWDAAKATERMRKLTELVRGAERQAGVPHHVTMRGVVALLEALAEPADIKWVGAARGAKPAGHQGTIAILTGPEGDLTAEEIAAAERAGFVRTTFGPHMLRAETAAVAGALLARQLGPT